MRYRLLNMFVNAKLYSLLLVFPFGLPGLATALGVSALVALDSHLLRDGSVDHG